MISYAQHIWQFIICSSVLGHEESQTLQTSINVYVCWVQWTQLHQCVCSFFEHDDENAYKFLWFCGLDEIYSYCVSPYICSLNEFSSYLVFSGNSALSVGFGHHAQKPSEFIGLLNITVKNPIDSYGGSSFVFLSGKPPCTFFSKIDFRISTSSQNWFLLKHIFQNWC